METMVENQKKRARINSFDQTQVLEEEVTSMSEQEVDLIYRMHKLVGDRWDLIAGRVPNRIPEEIERFWKRSQQNNI